MNENKHFYVYVHHNPVDPEEIVYVGKGCYGRAWDVSRNRNGHPDHQKWMQDLCQLGFIPEDWVEIITRGLSEIDAYHAEKEFLHSIGGTIFNRQSGERNYQAKLTDNQAREIYQSDETPRELAKIYGVSHACVYHIKKRTQWRAATACLVK